MCFKIIVFYVSHNMYHSPGCLCNFYISGDDWQIKQKHSIERIFFITVMINSKTDVVISNNADNDIKKYGKYG